MSRFPLGYITPSERTRQQHAAHVVAMNGMRPRFELSGPAAPDPGPFVCLPEVWKHPQMVAALGYEWIGTHQFSGSCVWAGGENVQMTLVGIEVIRLGQPETIVVPFGLFNYGLSRLRLGERSEGEGSLGSTYAASCNEDGTLDTADAELPDPHVGDGIEWGEAMEMKWSNGAAIAAKWKTQAKSRIVRSTAPVTDPADIRVGIRNLYPVTFACNNYIEPGTERIMGTGANQVCVGTLTGRGGHQTSLLMVYDHPDLGPLFWNQNQWGRKVYKADPFTGRQDGCWMQATEIIKAVRSLDAEIFIYSQFDGWPAQTISLGDYQP